ncbi:MAG: chromosomal replication initiator protein DnaA [bacterium]|nr:chromosomal replication initiator protein DnaA [bacterium]
MSHDAEAIWGKSVELLKSCLDPQIFSAWIEPLHFDLNPDLHPELNSEHTHLTSESENSLGENQKIDAPESAEYKISATKTHFKIYAPNKFCCEHIRRHYGPLISSTIQSVTGNENPSISFSVRELKRIPASLGSSTTNNNRIFTSPTTSKNPVGSRDSAFTTDKYSPDKQNPKSTLPVESGEKDSADNRADNVNGKLSFSERKNGSPATTASRRQQVDRSERYSAKGTNLNPNYNFANFIVGGCNEFASAVAMQVSRNPGTSYNPLFIYAGVGLGKTHLVNAIGNHVRRKGKSVLLVSSELFVNEMISSIQNGSMPKFKEKFRSIDMLIIDDIQFLNGKKTTQEEFFHTFNDLYNRRKQIVITSDKVPQELVGIEERLKTRFSSGISADMQTPDFETRVAILTKKADSSGIHLPEQVVHLLSEKIDTNIRELEGALNRIHAFSTLQNHPIDIDMAREALKAILPERNRDITPINIQEIVSRRYCVSVSDITGKRRTHNIARARHVAMYVCRKLTGCSYPEIGAIFGGRDHSTVIHAFRTIEEKISSDSDFQSEIELLEKELRGPAF